MTSFVDRVVLHVEGGKGGHGVASVHREKFKPLGGPDGGNGGNGGDVLLVVDDQSTTLLDYHRSPHRRAQNGAPGAGDEKDGAKGEDLILPVPPVGPAERLELPGAHRDTAVPAVPRLQVQHNPVDERGHCSNSFETAG